MTTQPDIDQPEDFETYTPEQILAAADEIKKLTPEDYLGMVAYITSLENAAVLPEAGAIIFTELRSPTSGSAYNLTVRHQSPIGAIREMADAIKYARSKYHLEPVKKHAVDMPARQVEQTVHPVTQPVPSIQAPNVVPQPSTPAQSQPTATVEEGQSGTGVLHFITIARNPVSGKRAVQFKVGNFRYPLQDQRSSDIIANLFDQNLGFQPAHFDTIGVEHSPSTWGGGTLYVDWQKNGKYMNVMRVHQ